MNCWLEDDLGLVREGIVRHRLGFEHLLIGVWGGHKCIEFWHRMVVVSLLISGGY